MAEADEIKIELFMKENEKDTNDGKKKWTGLSGYVVYEGKPILRVQGARVKDGEGKNGKTGETWTYKQYTMNFFGSEEKSSLFEDEVMFLQGSTNKMGDKISSNFHAIGKKGEPGSVVKNGFAPGIFDLSIPVSGWVGKENVKDQFGDDAIKVTLEFDEYKYLKAKEKAKKGGYDAKYSIIDAVNLSDEDLNKIAESFKYYSNFKKAFDGVREESEAPAV